MLLPSRGSEGRCTHIVIYYTLNRILRKIAALCVALNLYSLWAWIASRFNPADAPSRQYEGDARTGS